MIQHGCWEWISLASIHYSRLEIGEYTETGASSLNLSVEDQNYALLQSGLGLEVAHPVATLLRRAVQWQSLVRSLRGRRQWKGRMAEGDTAGAAT